MWLTVWVVVAAPILVLGSGTTPELEAIFTGRCWEYQHVVNPQAFATGLKNCTELWESFKAGFAYRHPCGVPIESYSDYREKARHSIPPDEQLFWENVFPFVNEFADDGQRYWTLAGTLSGYVLTGLEWCGQTVDPGINYSDCPTTLQCQGQGGGDSSVDALWKSVSLPFSDIAEGQVFVLFNGSHGQAYQNTSIFAEYELVNLTPEKGVTHLTLFVLHDLDKPILESCGETSILEFENVVKGQGLTYSCEDDPQDIRFYQCVDDVSTAECSPQTSIGSKEISPLLSLVFGVITSAAAMFS